MTDTKHPAEALADLYTADHWPSHMTLHDWAKSSAAMLRRIPLLEAVADELAAVRDSDLAAYKAQAVEIVRLRAALDEAQADASVAQMAVEALLAVATGSVQHTYRGDCTEPDRPDAYDPECPACVAIRTAREAQQ